MIVHQPKSTIENKIEYQMIYQKYQGTINQLIRRVKVILNYQESSSYTKARFYGTKFNVENVSKQDLRYFAKKKTPQHKPSLVVALRIDESASMKAHNQLQAAKESALIIYEFCLALNIPIYIYGDSADKSKFEQMSVYAYIDQQQPKLNDKYSLMNISGKSNNRDGMILKILSEKLIKENAQTKLIISISDGMPKAMPDYANQKAVNDMKEIISSYKRVGITFVGAAINQDKEIIKDIYGQDSYLDIKDLKQLPMRLVKIISRYL